MANGQPQTNGGQKPTSLDFNSLFLSGYSNEEIGQFSYKYQLPITISSTEQYLQKNPSEKKKYETDAKYKELLDSRFKNAQTMYVAFKDREQSDASMNSIYSARYDYNEDFAPAYQHYNITPSKKLVQTDKMYHYSNRGPIQMATPDEMGTIAGYYQDKDGNKKPLSIMQYADNFIVLDQDPETGEYYKRELGDGEWGNPELIQTVFGDRKLQSKSLFGSFGRGFVAAAVGKTVSGATSIIEAAGDLFGDANNMDKKSDDIGRYGSHWRAYFTHQNINELGRAFDFSNGAGAFWFAMGDGMGQATSMIATAYATGGALGLTNLAANVSRETAQMISITLAASQKAGIMRDELKAMGVDEKLSAEAFIPYLLTTIATERLIGPNILSNPTGRVEAMAFSNALKKEFQGQAFKSLSKEGKIYTIQNALSNFNKGILAKAESGVMGKAVIGGFEEYLEEAGEGFLDSGVQLVLNSIALAGAQELIKDNEGIELKSTIDDEGNEKHYIVNHNKPSEDPKEVSKDFADAWLKDMTYAQEVIKKEGLYETIQPFSGFGEEGVIAALSSGPIAGMTHMMNRGKKDLKNYTLHNYEMDEIANPKTRKLFEKQFSDLSDAGLAPEKHLDVDGNLITNQEKQQSRYDVAKEALFAQIDYDKKIIQDYGLNTAQIQQLNNGDRKLSARVVENQKTIDEANGEIKAINENEEIADEQKAPLIEAQTKRITEAKKDIGYILTKEPGTKYSQAYNDKVKSTHARLDLAQTVTDEHFESQKVEVNDEFRKSPAYQIFFNAALRVNNRDLYEVAKRVTFQHNAYVQQKSQEIEEKNKTLLADKDTEGSIRSILSEIDIPEGKESSGFKNANKLIKQILSTGLVEGDKTVLRDFRQVYENALSKLTEEQQGDISRFEEIMKDPTEAPEKELSELDKKVGKLSGEVSAFKKSEKEMTDYLSAKAPSFSNKFYYGDDQVRLSELEKDAANKFKGSDIRAKMLEIESLAKSIGDKIVGTKVSNEILSKPELKDNLSVNEVPLPDQLYNGIEGGKLGIKQELENNLRRINAIAEIADKESGNRNLRIQKINMRNNQLRKRSMLHMIDMHPDLFTDEKAILSEIPDYDPTNQGSLSKEEEKIQIQIEKKLIRAETMMHEKMQDKMDKAFVEKMIAPFLRSQGKKRPFESYFRIDDYLFKDDYVDQLDEHLKEDFLKSELSYFFFVNQLESIYGSSSNDVTKSRKRVYEKANSLNDPKYDIHASTLEQILGERLIINFFLNGKNEVMTHLIEIEKDIRKEKRGGKDEANYYDLASEYMLFLRGDYGTGKTQVSLNTAIEIYKDMTGDTPKLALIAPTSELLGTLSKSIINGSKTYTTKTFFNQQIDDADFIIWDEASLINKDQLAKIKEKSQAPIIFLGDLNQMQDLSRRESYPTITSAGLRTSPYTTQFSSNLPLLAALSSVFKSKMSVQLNMRSGFPKMYRETKMGVRIGGMYNETPENVINDFISSTNGDRALIFLTNQDAQDAIEKNKKLQASEYKSKIYSLEGDLDGTYDNTVESIQGLRKDEIYIAIPIENLKSKDDIIINNNTKARIGYTAVGRARTYVSLVGDTGLNTNNKEEVAWIEDAEMIQSDLEEGKKEKRDLEIERLGKILDNSLDKSSRVQTESTETTSETEKKSPKKGERVYGKGNTLKVGFAEVHRNKNYKNVRNGSITRVNGYYYVNEKTGEDFNTKEPVFKNVYYVMHSDGVTELVEFFSDYKLNDDPITDETKNVEYFSKSSDLWNENKIWATAYTVEKHEGLIHDQARAIKDLLLNSGLYNLVLEYRPTAELFSDDDSDYKEFKDVLTVNIKRKEGVTPAMERTQIAKWKNEGNFLLRAEVDRLTDRNLSDEQFSDMMNQHRVLMTMPDTEYDYKIDGKNRLIKGMDYLNDIDAIIKKIDSGFDNSEIGQSLREKNKFLAMLRHEGANENTNFGIITNYNSFSGLLKYDKENLKSANSFVGDQIGRGIIFSEDYIQTRFDDGRIAVIKRYAWNRTPNDSDPYVIFRRKSLGELGSNVVKDLKTEFLDDKDNLDKINLNMHPNDVNKIINGTRIYQLLANNNGVINADQNKRLGKFLSDYISFNGNYVNINKNSQKVKDLHVKVKIGKTFKKGDNSWFLVEKEIFKELVDLLTNSKTWSGNMASEFSKLYLPALIDRENKKIINTDELYTTAQEIHHPYAHIDITALKQKYSGSELDTKPTESGDIVDHGNDIDEPGDLFGDEMFGDEKTNPKPHIVDHNEKRANQEKVERLVRWLLGEDFLQNNTEFTVKPMSLNGIDLYGLMYNGKVKFELTEKGIENSTPRHEIQHIVWNYLLDNKTKDAITEEVRKIKGNKNLNPDQVDEWLSRKFGKGGIKYNTNPNLLQRFFRALEDMFKRYILKRPLITQYFRDINNGVYRDREIHIGETDIIRGNAKDTKADFFEEEDLVDPESPYSDYAALNRFFRRKEEIFYTRQSLGYSILKKSFLSNDLDAISLEDGIKQIESHFLSPNRKAIGEEDTNIGKKVKQLTKEDLPLLNREEKIKYNSYQLSKPKVLRTFIKDLFPGYDFENGFSTYGKSKDSIRTTPKDQVNPDDVKSDLFKLVMTLIPQRHTRNGKLTNPIKGKFVNVNDLELSLSDAAINAKELMKINPDMDESTAFKNALLDHAQAMDDNMKSNNIYSFLAQFYGVTLGNQDKYHAGLNSLVYELRKSGKNDRADDLSRMINQIQNYYMSLHKVNRVEMEIKDNKGVFNYEFKRQAQNRYEENKNIISDKINNRLFLKGSGELKADVVSQFKGKDRRYDISSNGLSYVFRNRGEEELSPIIVVKDGKAQFTELADEASVAKLASFLGMKNVGISVWRTLFNNSAPKLNKILSKRFNLKYAGDNWSRDIVADGLMNMFWSIASYNDLHNRLADNVELHNGVIDSPAFKSAKVEILKDVPYSKEMKAFRDRIGSGAQDGMIQNTSEIEEQVNTDVVLPKPNDFYNFLNLLGLAQIYVRSDDYSNWHYGGDGKKRYNINLSSHVKDLLNNGSEGIAKLFSKSVDNTNNPHVSGDEITNAFLDENDQTKLLSFDDYSTIKRYVGTDNPNTKDMGTMAVQAFAYGLRKTSDVKKDQILNVATTNSADTGHLYNMQITTGRERVVDVNLDKETGNIKSAVMNDNYVNRHIDKLFKYYARENELSRQRWINTIADSPFKGYFSGVSKKIASDPVKFRESMEEGIAGIKKANESKKFANFLESSGLKNNVDYLIKGDKNNPNIEAGHATRFDDDIWNKENHDIWNNSKDKSKFRDAIFTIEYNKMRGELSRSGFKLGSEIKNTLKVAEGETNYGYLNEKTGEWNPIMKSFFYSFYIFNEYQSQITTGSRLYFADADEKSKRTAATYTGRSVINTDDEYGIGKNSHIVVMDDIEYQSSIAGENKSYKEGDGLGVMPIFTSVWFDIAAGGKIFGSHGNSMMKPIYNHKDSKTGNHFQIKQAIDTMTDVTYANNQAYRKMQKDAFDVTDKKMKKIYGNEYDINLNDLFQKFYKQTGKPGERSALQASKDLQRYLVEKTIYGEDIRNNLVWQFVNKSAVKYGNTFTNKYNPLTDTEVDLNTVDVDMKSFGVILNPAQDIHDTKKSAPPIQQFSYFGIGSKENRKVAAEINESLASIVRNARKEVNREIDKYEVKGFSKARVHKIGNEMWSDERLEKTRKFLRDRGIHVANTLRDAGNTAELIADSDISIEIPKVAIPIIRSYRSYINNIAIRKKMEGVRMNQAPGNSFTIYEKDGLIYTLQEIERLEEEEFEIGKVPAKYKARGLRAMESTKDGVNRAEVLIPYMHMKKFGISPRTTLNEMFTILSGDTKYNFKNIDLVLYDKNAPKVIKDELSSIFKGSEVSDILGSLNQEVARFVEEKVTRLRENVVAGILKKDLPDLAEYSTEEIKELEPNRFQAQFENYERLLRGENPKGEVQQLKEGEFTLDKDQLLDVITQYYIDANKSLLVFANRVPSNRVSSGYIGEVVGFINDNGNVLYQNSAHTLLADDDYDIDQKTVYTYAFNKYGEIEQGTGSTASHVNNIIDSIFDYYNNTKNKDRIFVLSDIQKLREARDQLKQEQKSTDDPSSFATRIKQYETNRVGDTAIGIIANAISGYAYIASLGNKLTQVAPGLIRFAEGLTKTGEQNPMLRQGNMLQAALDNAKEQVLAALGIRNQSVSIAMAMIADGLSYERLRDFLNKGLVRKAFDKAHIGESVTEKTSDYKLVDIVHDLITENKKLSPDEYQELIDKRDKIQEHIAQMEKDNPMAIIFNNEILNRKYFGLENNIQDINQQIENQDSIDDLVELERYIVQAEAISRFSNIVSLRKGLETVGFDFYKQIKNIELSLGMTIDQFNRNHKITEHDYIENFKTQSNQYLQETNAGKKARMIEHQKKVFNAIDLPELVRQFPHFAEYMIELERQKDIDQTMWWFRHEEINRIGDNFLQRAKLASFPYKSLRAGYFTAVNDLFLDYHFKRTGKDEQFNIAIPEETVFDDVAEGFVVSNLTTYKNVDITSANGRSIFANQFPQFISFLKDLSENYSKEQIGNILSEIDPSYAGWAEAISDNQFIDRIEVMGYINNEKVGLSDNAGLTPQEILVYSNEFQKLPRKLRRMFEINDLINYKMEYRKNSITDIIGTEMYKGENGLSTSIKMFKIDLDKGINAETTERFVRYVQHQPEMIAYVSKAKIDDQLVNNPNAAVKDLIVPETRQVWKNFGPTYRKIVARWNPAKSVHEEEFIHPRRGGFESDYSQISGLRNIRTFTARELDKLEMAKLYPDQESVVKRKFALGHKYGIGEYYQAENGIIVKVGNISGAEVTFIPIEMSQEKIEEITKEQFESDLLKSGIVDFSKRLENFKKEERRRIASKSLITVVQSLGLKYKVVNNQDVAGTINEGKKAWTENGKLVFNDELVTWDSPLHEYQHIFNEYLYQKNRPLYDELMKDVDDIITENGSLVKKIRNKYPNLNKEDFRKEVFATIGGFYSMPIVKEFMLKNNIAMSDNVIDRFFNRVRYIAQKIWNWIKKDSGVGTYAVSNKLGEFFEEIYRGALKGENQEFIDFAKNFYSDKSYSSVDLNEKRKLIDTLNNMAEFFRNRSTGLSLENKTKDELTNYIYTNLRQDNDGYRRWEFDGEIFEYPNALSTENTKKKIQEEIVPLYNEYEKVIKGLIKDFANKINKNKINLADIAQEVFPSGAQRSRYTEKTLTDLMFFMGLNDDYQEVMLYSDLKDHSNSSLRNLYKKEFEGNNPLIVLHGIDDTGTIDISILDGTSKPLGRDIASKGYTLGSAFMSDGKYSSKFRASEDMLKNSDADIRKFLLGVTIMQMNQNENVKIRNAGVVQLTRKRVKHHMITDINSVINNIKVVSQEKAFTDNIRNESILSVITNDKLLNKEYPQSFLSRVKYYLKTLEETGEIKIGNQIRKELLFDPSTSNKDILRALIKMQKVLEQREGDHYSEPLYQMIGGAIIELKRGHTGFINSMVDMVRIKGRLLTGHIIDNEIVETVVNSVKRAVDKVVDKTRKYQKAVNETTAEIVKYYENRHAGAVLEAKFKDLGSKYFENMYKKVEIDGKSYNLPYIHWDVTNKETKQLIQNEDLTQLEIDYANLVLDEYEKRLVDDLYHTRNQELRNIDSKGRPKYTREMAEEEIAKRYERGWIPVISKSMNELLVNEKYEAALKKFKDQIGNINDFLTDEAGSSNVLDEVEKMFSGQEFADNVIKKAGLDRDESGNYIVINEEANIGMSTNVEKIMNYKMITGIRKEVFENDVIPVYNSAVALLNMYKSHGKSLDNYNEFLDEYYNKIIHKESGDIKAQMTVPIAGEKIDVGKTVRGAQRIATFMLLWGKPIIWGKSFAFNEITQMIVSTSTSLGDIGVSEENKSFMPGPVATTKAKGWVMAHPIKAYHLGRFFHIIQSTEGELVGDPIINETDKLWLQEKWGHIGNWATDAFARVSGAVAMMMKEGSFDAYTYNEQTGEFDYNEKKDRRFYSADGQLKTAKGEHAIRKAVIDDLIEDELMPEGADKMTRGHTYQMAERFKWYGDRYIVGSFDPTIKALIGNVWTGALFSQFRLFQPDKLFNAGLFAKKRNTLAGSTYKAVKDADGNWIAKKELMEIEGVYQSWGEMLRFIRDAQGMTFNQWWNAQGPIRRMNIMKGVINTAVLATLMMLVKGLIDEDDERKFTWVYSDLSVIMMAGEWYKNPIPMMNAASQLSNIALGKENYESLLKMVPGPSAYYHTKGWLKNKKDQEVPSSLNQSITK